MKFTKLILIYKRLEALPEAVKKLAFRNTGRLELTDHQPRYSQPELGGDLSPLDNLAIAIAYPRTCYPNPHGYAFLHLAKSCSRSNSIC
jgi:hypothetical protein